MEYTTAKAPAAEAAYDALAGTYEMKVYSQREKKETTLQMVVAPLYINESYTFHFPNGDFSPVDGEYVDKFVLGYDNEKKALVLPNGLLGSEDVTWGFRDSKTGEKFNGGIVFYAEIGEDTDAGEKSTVPETLVYNWTDDHNTLNLATDLGGKTMHWKALIVTIDAENKLQPAGLFSMFDFIGSTSLVKTAAPASTKSVKKVDLMHPEFPVKDGGSYLLK